MRIWDIDAGFLNDKSLLGEHRELHGIVSIIQNKKKGYSCHPETLRWPNHVASLAVRHHLLVSEMQLRGFNHNSPVNVHVNNDIIWPEIFINSPLEQYGLLAQKYADKPPGRIPLPKNTQELWAFHKYSIMARDPELYQQMGFKISKKLLLFEDLCDILILQLRTPPSKGRLKNAIDHMWGYVADSSASDIKASDSGTRLKKIQILAFSNKVDYLIRSTALGELMFWHTFINTP
ncbi:MAG: hypothetical protein KKE62_19530 [Proteobacteria bacterium]|nr:hypothetical protein [Pseudomonadota bacterium]MBU1390017.1 hypothetical protein [Pseudomonadota bacterium]MBU1545032.1 hypothetical protein [Pseudomonadota bacterium]MBU2480364.1 hypothetical protein [Pseudomonadota bacterium]